MDNVRIFLGDYFLASLIEQKEKNQTTVISLNSSYSPQYVSGICLVWEKYAMTSLVISRCLPILLIY